MKQLFMLMCALGFTVSLSGQQMTTGELVVGNSDVIGLTGSTVPHFLVENGPDGFYWVGGSYYGYATHPKLEGIDSYFTYLYFIKYDENGIAQAGNQIQGPYWPQGAYSFNGGLTIFGTSFDDVLAGEKTLSIGESNRIEFLASYNDMGVLQEIEPIWNPGPAYQLSTVCMMDKLDGSIYIAGSTNETLNLAGYGPIGDTLDNYLYVVKYDRNLVFQDVFIAGFDDAAGTEWGFYSEYSFAISPDGKGSVWITGTHGGDRTPVIGGDTLSGSYESMGVFAVKLDADLKKERVLGGSMSGWDEYDTHIYKGLAMENGDVVMVGQTTTGYFSLEGVDFKFENGSYYKNLFAFRLTPEGVVTWERALQTMFSLPQKKGANGTEDISEVQSESFEQYFDGDAILWNNETLYMTGLFMSDSFEINGKVMNKRFYQGAFVAAMDLNSGEEWGYALSANSLHLYGFDLDISGNPSLMGSAGGIMDLDYLETDSAAYSRIFLLGLDYSGKPLWKNNAYTQGQVGGFQGYDLEVLRDGKVFSSIITTVPEPLVIGQDLVNSADIYTAMMIPLNVDNKVGGFLKDKSGMSVYPGTVKAYKSTKSGPFPEVGLVQVDASGYYLFESLYPGQYRLLAEPDLKMYPEGMPTYLGGAVSWDDSRPVPVDTETNTTFSDITLSELPMLTPEDGSGQMSGNVSYEDEVVAKGTKGRPAGKRSVILKRKASQVKSTSAEDITAYVDTDDLGDYMFDYVPDGDYILIVDIPGLPMLQTYDVNILANKIVSGLDFVVKNQGIETSNIIGVESVPVDRFMIFPNPGNGLLNIEFSVSGDYYVRVFNMVGELVDSKEYVSVAGLVDVDISDLQSGMYFLQIEGDQGTESVKYMKE